MVFSRHAESPSLREKVACRLTRRSRPHDVLPRRWNPRARTWMKRTGSDGDRAGRIAGQGVLEWH
eukprot:173996-Rhodomonas_salina.1